MIKFFLMTRGRTGSTAVIDELNNANGLCATQELFIEYTNDERFPNSAQNPINTYYQLIPMFDLWKRINKETIPEQAPGAAELYIQQAEFLASKKNANCFGFKMLSHHFKERPFLSPLLRRQQYKALYLTRNIPRQVLSGMVANLRGTWNSKNNVDDNGTYHIDLDDFQWLVENETRAMEADKKWLVDQGFLFTVIRYEQFCYDRKSFFESVFKFLGMPVQLPPRSDWSIMIKDLRKTVSNYEEVVKRTGLLGMHLEK